MDVSAVRENVGGSGGAGSDAMSTPKLEHAPGPWFVEAPPPDAYTCPDLRLDKDVRFWVIDKRSDSVIANVLKWRGEPVANARLIAAAPDLLDIARTIVAICDSGDTNLAQLACMETSPLVDAARAAIQSATGAS